MCGGRLFKIGKRCGIGEGLPVWSNRVGAGPGERVYAGGEIDPGKARLIMLTRRRQTAAMPVENVPHRASTSAASRPLSISSIPAP